MSDQRMYDILGKFQNLDPKLTPVKETEVKDPVYENVEARGSITEAVKSLEEKYQGWKKTVAAVKKGGSAEDPAAVAASIGRKKYGKKKFQKAAAAGKKLGEAVSSWENKWDFQHSPSTAPKAEQVGNTLASAGFSQDDIDGFIRFAFVSGNQRDAGPNFRKMNRALMSQGVDVFEGKAAKPDFLDVDKDGNKKETFKKAVKDKKQVEESGGPYELYNPKHPKFAANYKKFKAKNPDAKLEDFIAAMKKREHGVSEGVLDQVRSGTLGQPTTSKNFDPKTGKPLHGQSYANAANAVRNAQPAPAFQSGRTTVAGGTSTADTAADALAHLAQMRDGYSKRGDTERANYAQEQIRLAKAGQPYDSLNEASYSAKAARAGKDIGKPGKAFAKIAKSAGEYDPAPVDPEAVAKRKRLQALKDKQEDERGHDTKKSTVRKVAGKAYGGAAQKDDAEKDDLDEAMSDEQALERYHELIKQGMDPDDAEVEVWNTDHDDELNEYSQAEYDQAMADFKAKGGRAKQLPAGSAKNPISTASRHIGGRGEVAKKGKATRTGKHALSTSTKAVVDVAEVAPPGAKAERMVKHIKKGYAKDGKLTKREKGIAYATAWKAHKAGKLQESRMIQEGDYFYEKLGKALAEKNPTLNTADPSFVTAVRQEMVAQGIEPNRARNIIMMDDDFISDVATSYGHYCKEIAECGSPMNSFVEETPMMDAKHELDEIARLAGLPVEETEIYDTVNHEETPDTMDEGNAFTGKLLATKKGEKFELGGKEFTDTSDLGESALEEEEMGEGNEFSGALAKAKAAGAKEFEVDGKKYTVKEDVNLNLTANGEEDVVKLITKLAGMPVVAVAAQEAQPVIDMTGGEELEEAGPTERDVEYTNTPREEVAGVEAAIPSGTDLHRAKKSYSDKPYRGDNPMAVKEEALWKAYESMISDLKD